MASALGLPRTRARELATSQLEASLQRWKAESA